MIKVLQSWLRFFFDVWTMIFNSAHPNKKIQIITRFKQTNKQNEINHDYF
jgi:hypothetical protein